MLISARQNVVVSGRIDASRQGPLLGPGAPTDISEMRNGGTYRGSGGNIDRSSRFFLNIQGQVISIFAFSFCALSAHISYFTFSLFNVFFFLNTGF